jgi:2-keto-3-deoxy-L-rhamnonate aldolase RhmA
VTSSIVPRNPLRSKLADGGLAVGTMLVEVRQPSIMRILANGGFDFVLIDNEHGPFTVETIADLSRAARDAGPVSSGTCEIYGNLNRRYHRVK